MKDFEKPFDGAVSRFLDEEAPAHIRNAIEGAGGRKVLAPSYPYDEEMGRKSYEKEYAPLQIELARMQRWVRETGARVVVVFEGRDAAGKGGTIKRFSQNLNPRGARIVALSKPSDTERGQWYFQRYVAHLPTAGEIAFFDRSWYNRAVVEQVFGFCTAEERERFFIQVPEFERLLVTEGIWFFKIWLTVGRAEQLRRFLEREADPLKHWKLSRIDIEGLQRWDAYSEAVSEMFRRSHLPHAPWITIRSDDKKRARLAAIRKVLAALPYSGKDTAALDEIDAAICGGPELLPDENA